MSANEQHTTDYQPIPLTHEESFGQGLYNAPPSPDPYHTQFNPSGTGVDSSSLPIGASQPRFLGAALYDDPAAPRVRDSYASSHNTLQSAGNGSEYTGSVYALNDTLGATPLTHGPYSAAYHDDPHDSFTGDTGGHPMSPIGQPRFLEEKHAAYAAPRAHSKRKYILAALAGLILLLLAVLLPVYFAVIRPKSNSNLANDSANPANPTATGKNGTPSVAAAVTGGDGSQVTTDDGSTFTYHNSFGGYWYWDRNDPFNDGARAQSWTPALNETFNYGIDIIRGLAPISCCALTIYL